MKISCMILLSLVFAVSCRTLGEGTNNNGKRISNQVSGKEITEKRWNLSLIGGEPVDWKGEINRQPHIVLTKVDKKFFGSGGCNSLSGSYNLRKGGSISFIRIGSTKMACLQMNPEKQLLEVLLKTDRYITDGLILELYSKDVLLARFVATGPE